MKILLILLALWPGTMIAQGCSQEEDAVKTLENEVDTAKQKLTQCKNKPKELTPEEKYNKEWTIMSERHKQETLALRREHWEQHEALMKETGFDPRTKKVTPKK